MKYFNNKRTQRRNKTQRVQLRRNQKEIILNGGLLSNHVNHPIHREEEDNDDDNEHMDAYLDFVSSRAIFHPLTVHMMKMNMRKITTKRMNISVIITRLYTEQLILGTRNTR